MFVNVFTELVNTEGFSSHHNQTKIYLLMGFFKGMSLSWRLVQVVVLVFMSFIQGNICHRRLWSESLSPLLQSTKKRETNQLCCQDRAATCSNADHINYETFASLPERNGNNKKKPPLSGCGSCLGGLRRAEHLENDLTWTRDKWPDSFHRRSTADVAGMKGSRRPRGRRFLPREHISLNSLVEIGPPDGILCISPTRHSILLLPAVLPSVTAIMGRVINIWSPSLKFFFFFTLHFECIFQ